MQSQVKSTISYKGNRVVWKIPTFDSFPERKDQCTTYSPQFSLAKRSWHLFTRLESSLDIGVYQVTKKISDFKVRLSIIRGNLELSSFGTLSCGGRGTFAFMDRSEFDDVKDRWLPGGNLSVSFAIEDLRQDDSEKEYSKKTTHIGKKKSENTSVMSTETYSQLETDAGIRKLQNDLEFLLKGNISDLIVRIEDREFKCHRSILGARSPVFLAMVTHDTKEKATGVIEVQDAKPDIFSDFLHYLYTGILKNLNTENVVDLYTLSDKYQVIELKNNCLKHMLKNISMENFCDFINLSLRHNETELIDACIRFFKETWNSLEIIKTCKWQSFMSENPIACNELLIKLLESKRS